MLIVTVCTVCTVCSIAPLFTEKLSSRDLSFTSINKHLNKCRVQDLMFKMLANL